jgi:hypothetical protein
VGAALLAVLAGITDRHLDVHQRLLQAGDALRGGQEADRGDVVGAAVQQEPDRRRQGAAGGEHRVQDVALPSRQVVGQTRGVRRRLQRPLVADHAQETHLRGGKEPGHAVQHAEAGAEDGHHQRLRPGQAHALGRADWCGNGHIGDAYVAGRFVGEERHELVGQAAKCGGICGLVTKRSELVGDEGMIGHEGFHIGSR